MCLYSVSFGYLKIAFPSCSAPQKTFFGNRSLDIGTRWSVYHSCADFRLYVCLHLCLLQYLCARNSVSLHKIASSPGAWPDEKGFVDK